MKWINILVPCLFVLVLIYAESDLPGFGYVDTPSNIHVSNEYIQRSYKDTHTPNFVTSILADYRGYDTLGETTVIFTSGIICILLLARRIR